MIRPLHALALCVATAVALVPGHARATSRELQDARQSEMRKTTHEWVERYGLSEREAEEQLRSSEEGVSKIETHQDRVADPYDFHWKLIGRPEAGSTRTALILRSNQPAPENLVELTAAAGKAGIRPSEILVINLRIENNLEKSYIDGAVNHRNSEIQAISGLRTLYLPIVDHTIPTDDQVKQVLAAARSPENKLVVVHCFAGRARTGVMVAAIRIALDGWSVERALSEAAENGMNRKLQIAFVRSHAEAWKQWVAAPQTSEVGPS